MSFIAIGRLSAASPWAHVAHDSGKQRASCEPALAFALH